MHESVNIALADESKGVVAVWSDNEGRLRAFEYTHNVALGCTIRKHAHLLLLRDSETSAVVEF